MKKFEYRIRRFGYGSEDEMEDILNELGKDGWEVVSIDDEQNKHIGKVYLKREIIEKEKELLTENLPR